VRARQANLGNCNDLLNICRFRRKQSGRRLKVLCDCPKRFCRVTSMLRSALQNSADGWTPGEARSAPLGETADSAVTGRACVCRGPAAIGCRGSRHAKMVSPAAGPHYSEVGTPPLQLRSKPPCPARGNSSPFSAICKLVGRAAASLEVSTSDGSPGGGRYFGGKNHDRRSCNPGYKVCNLGGGRQPWAEAAGFPRGSSRRADRPALVRRGPTPHRLPRPPAR
jgi:hypothetical protein